MVRPNGRRTMAPTPRFEAARENSRSTLIYGSGETAMSWLAVGLARRTHRGIAWIDCIDRTSPLDPAWSARTGSDRGFREFRGIEPSGLLVQEVPAERLDGMIRAESSEARDRIGRLLGLPSVLQSLISLGPNGHDAPPVIVRGLEALPDVVVHGTFGNPRVHETLHESGISLVATYSGAPVRSVQDAFDEVYRVDDRGSEQWPDSYVWSERGLTDIDLLLPRPLRQAWSELRLDPDLLPT